MRKFRRQVWSFLRHLIISGNKNRLQRELPPCPPALENMERTGTRSLGVGKGGSSEEINRGGIDQLERP